MTVSTRPPQGDTDALVILAIAAAGDDITPCLHYASEDDRAAAAYDLASAIRCAAPLLTESERATMAGYLHPEGGAR